MSFCRLIIPGVSFLVFSSFGFRPPASGFLILIVASRFLHPYSTDDKTSRLMVKKFSSEGHTERFTELHAEEGGGR